MKAEIKDESQAQCMSTTSYGGCPKSMQRRFGTPFVFIFQSNNKTAPERPNQPRKQKRFYICNLDFSIVIT